MEPSIIFHPNQWCTPVVIYALLAVAGVILVLVGAEQIPNPLPTSSKVAFAIIWVVLTMIMMYIMLYLCEKGYEWGAWLILLLPLIIPLIQKLRGK